MRLKLLDPKILIPIEDFSRERVLVVESTIKKDTFWKVPICVAKENFLIMDGHHRREIAIRMKLKKVPCFIYSYDEVKLVSLNNCEVSKDIILQNFSEKRIFPYKTAKHFFPDKPEFTKIKLSELI